MNKKSILGLGALMSVLACSLAFAVAPNKVQEASAKTTDADKTYVDHYLARYKNQDDLPMPTSATTNVDVPAFDVTSNLTLS